MGIGNPLPYYISYEGIGEVCVCQFILLVIIFIISYIYKRGWNPFRSMSEDEKDYCPKCGKPMGFAGEECKWCGYKPTKSADVDYHKNKEKVRFSSSYGKGKKKSLFSSLKDSLDGKETCDECGTELEYKEEMDSWYCPTCHSYK
ncbi:MAG: hypothetical protein ACQESD_01765 [Thermoplasmatota archaeon]